jgi:hypothetical protein
MKPIFVAFNAVSIFRLVMSNLKFIEFRLANGRLWNLSSDFTKASNIF